MAFIIKLIGIKDVIWVTIIKAFCSHGHRLKLYAAGSKTVKLYGSIDF